MEAALQAVQPRSFGKRRVSPSLPPVTAPENPALAWVKSQVEFQRERLQDATQSARPMAGAVSAWVYTLASAGIPLSGMAFAGCVAASKAVFASVLKHLKSIEFRRPAPPPSNPLLDAMAQSWRGTFVRTLAYLGGIGAVSVFAAEMFQPAPIVAAMEPVARPEWINVAKPYPAFHLSLTDVSDDHRYVIQRHGDGGGRKDVLTWGEPGQSVRHVMIEIYRPGTELQRFSDPASEIEKRAAEFGPTTSMRASLPIETKFGPVSTVDFAIGRFGGGHCVGFTRAFDEPRLQIAGLSCSMDAIVDRSAMACALDKLTLMSAGSDPDIAKLFAQAELKRNFCGQRDPLLYATPKRPGDAGKSVLSTLRGRMSAR